MSVEEGDSLAVLRGGLIQGGAAGAMTLQLTFAGPPDLPLPVISRIALGCGLRGRKESTG